MLRHQHDLSEVHDILSVPVVCGERDAIQWSFCSVAHRTRDAHQGSRQTNDLGPDVDEKQLISRRSLLTTRPLVGIRDRCLASKGMTRVLPSIQDGRRIDGTMTWRFHRSTEPSPIVNLGPHQSFADACRQLDSKRWRLHAPARPPTSFK